MTNLEMVLSFACVINIYYIFYLIKINDIYKDAFIAMSVEYGKLEKKLKDKE